MVNYYYYYYYYRSDVGFFFLLHLLSVRAYSARSNRVLEFLEIFMGVGRGGGHDETTRIRRRQIRAQSKYDTENSFRRHARVCRTVAAAAAAVRGHGRRVTSTCSFFGLHAEKGE